MIASDYSPDDQIAKNAGTWTSTIDVSTLETLINPIRSDGDDFRVCYHEASHAVIGRLLTGSRIGGVTVTPTDSFAGFCWGPQFKISKLSDSDYHDVPDICELMKRFLPRIGDSKSSAPEVFSHVHTRVIELVAGTVGENLFVDGPAWVAHDDLRQARAYATLVSSSFEAVERFLDFCRAEASALLTVQAHIVYALAAELRIARTMNGAEVDAVIERAVAEKSQSDEHRRRAAWAETCASASKFSRLRPKTRRSNGCPYRQPDTDLQ
jgi:hypothetical protein